MGTIRFQIPNSQRIVVDQAKLIYMAGLDGVPIPRELSFEKNILMLKRESSDSGKVYVPFRTTSQNLCLIPTGTVVERDAAYPLLLELARGTIDRLRNQHDFWKRCGFRFSDEMENQIQSVATLFCQAARQQSSRHECDQVAETALDQSLDLIKRLSDDYATQVIELRRAQTAKLPTLAGYAVNGDWSSSAVPDETVDQLFDSSMIRVNWKHCEPKPGQFCFDSIQEQIDSLRARNRQIAIGPLVRLDEKLLPDFVLDTSEFDAVRRSVRGFVAEVTKRFGTQVQMINVFGGLNASDEIALPGDYRLRLAIDAIESCREHNSETPVLIGFDQPWCESQTDSAHLSPLQTADAVARANINLSGFLLEIHWGIYPSGTIPRDPIQLHTFFDLWSQFELPLIVEMSIPSSCADDALASRDDEYVERCADVDCLNQQSETVTSLLKLMFGRPFIQGIFWGPLTDSSSHRFRNTGLFDHNDQPKPATEAWRAMRQDHLA